MSGARDLQHSPATLALKVASKALVSAVGGGEDAGATVGARQQRMSDCGNANTADFLRLDEIAALEDVSLGSPNAMAVTRALAHRQKAVVVMLPASLPSGSDLLTLMAKKAQTSGDLTAAICAAYRDGDVSPSEAREIAVELDELIETAVAMREVVRLMEGDR